MSARRCALEALSTWEKTSAHAEDILADLAVRHRLSSPDRGLAIEILYGTIRNLFLLDGLIDELRRGRIKPETQNLLRIGLQQIFLSEIAEHAAVNETVNLARSHERSLVNAILRNSLRRREELERRIATWPEEDRFSHPAFLLERWHLQFGEEACEALCRWNNQPAVNYARLNPLARDREALDRVRSEVQPSLIGPQYPDFFRIEGPPSTEWLAEGLIYVQDPSTSLACRLLDPKPGEIVLDACAAPGGKTALLAALMENTGTLLATDLSETRLERTCDNLYRLNADLAGLRPFDWAKATRDNLASLPAFDAILLDVPCSNSGVMRRRVDVRWRLQPGDFARQATLQKHLLGNVAKILKPGGRLVYSTCSLDEEENEQVVSASGLAVETTVRSRPWESGYDGAFAALLRPA